MRNRRPSQPIRSVPFGTNSTLDSEEADRALAEALAVTALPAVPEGIADLPTQRHAALKRDARAPEVPAQDPSMRRTVAPDSMLEVPRVRPRRFGLLVAVGGAAGVVVIGSMVLLASALVGGLGWQFLSGGSADPPAPVAQEVLVVPVAAVAPSRPPDVVQEPPASSVPAQAGAPPVDRPHEAPAKAPRLAAPAEKVEHVVAEPTPEPPPPVSSVTVATAHVTMKGDATSLVLISPTGLEYTAPGDVPPATYKLRVVFEGLEPQLVGEIAIAAGESRTVSCSRSLRRCK